MVLESMRLHLPYFLRCENLKNPIGIEEQLPRFSWKIRDERRGAAQTAYCILVASSKEYLEADVGDIWDSGKTDSDQSIYIEYSGAVLQSFKRYFWKVRTWDQDGIESPWSEISFFEMGILQCSEWKASWISLKDNLKNQESHVPCPYFRKTFIARGQAKSARLYASSLGVCESYINGLKVGEDLLAPGWTDYTKRVPYVTYDVTDSVVSGENTIGSIISSGWYCGHIGWYGDSKWYGDKPHLLLQLRIEYEDGSTDNIVTDSSWKVSTGPIIESSLYKGETYDARISIDNWSINGFDDSQWGNPDVNSIDGFNLVAKEYQTVRRIMQLNPVSIRSLEPRTFVVDFGQNMAGHVRIKIRGERGTKVTIRHGELIYVNGSVNSESHREAFSIDRYILKGGGEETFEPTFTFRGFRYVEVKGYEGPLKSEDIVAIVIHTDLDETGNFECSNSLINKLFSNIKWTQRSNYIDIPIDCPTRDERMGWMADMSFFLPVSCFNMDISAFIYKWMDSIRDAQREDGLYRNCAPSVQKVLDTIDIFEVYTAGWSDPGVIIPWIIYMHYGDRRILERHYESMIRFMDYVESQSTNYLCSDFGLADWFPIDDMGLRKPYSCRKTSYIITGSDICNSAYFALCAKLMYRISLALGKPDQAEKYETLFNNIKAAFIDEYVTCNGRIVANSQTAYALALAFDLLPKDKREDSAQYLVEDIKNRGYHLSTGFLGTTFVLDALKQTGNLDAAYRLIVNEDCPSWLYPIKHGGATTGWERLNGWTWDKGLDSSGINSMNHGWSCSVGEFLYNVIGGINRDMSNPGFKHIIINPRPGGEIHFAKCEYDSPYGKIICNWKAENDAFLLDLKVPANTYATVHMPLGKNESVNENGKPVKSADGIYGLTYSKQEVIFNVNAGAYNFVSF